MYLLGIFYVKIHNVVLVGTKAVRQHEQIII